MSTPLKLETADLEGTASALRGLSHNTTQLSATLNSAWGQLDSGWHSYCREDADDYFRHVMTELKHMEDMLAQMGGALHGTAGLVAVADEEAVKFFVLGDGSLTDQNGAPIIPLLPETGDDLSSPEAGLGDDILNWLCRTFGIFCPPLPTPTPTPPPVTIYPPSTGAPQPPTSSPPQSTPTPPPISTPLPPGFPPPPTINQHSQYDPNITGELGSEACGLISFSAAAEALGLSYEDAMEWFKLNAGANGYSISNGIQPSDYLKLVQKLIVEKHLLLSATEVKSMTNADTVERMRQELLKNNQIIVDILAMKPSTSTTPTSDPSAGMVPGTYAHFARVVGFSADGKTAYLAESLDANKATVAVNTETLLQSMKNPEGRAFNNAPVREQVD
jgi:uncharacterized protein YukE